MNVCTTVLSRQPDSDLYFHRYVHTIIRFFSRRVLVKFLWQNSVCDTHIIAENSVMFSSVRIFIIRIVTAYAVTTEHWRNGNVFSLLESS